ncbi:putative thiol peroxidase [Poriferisphaera corsica]|uniref:Thiol peroxidase n=1 Tax=Poriferisphaera corsica TaxID=2528020 RepID=A0A517YWZ4_9BACT|nr:thiol peroxidase [Poriferisphaera corsica]QDU34744.1 putative thiol peroxidase [Poriferisphaera corsica]
MTERAGAITFKGNPMTLVGDEITVGQKAPDFQLRANDFSVKSLADYAGKVKIISIIPSLDTPVCDAQTRHFNTDAASLGDGVVILTISVDLPPAQKRWCGAAGIDAVECLSDYYDHSFGSAYGVRVKELGLLARQIVVLDKDDTVKYVEVVPEIAQEPNYDAAIAAAKELL